MRELATAAVADQRRPGCQYDSDPMSNETKTKTGLQGRNKIKWSKEELKVVWECYLRSKIIAPDAYIDCVMDMWNGRDVNLRSQAAVLSKIRDIRIGRSVLLSNFEKREIEAKVNSELLNQSSMQSESDEVDFFVENTHETSRLNYSDSASPDCTFVSGEDDFSSLSPRVLLHRVDTYSHSGSVRGLLKEEENILSRIREIFTGSNIVDIPSLKDKDRFEVGREVALVNALLHNVFIPDVNVTSVNKLLYAGSYVVCERLGLFKKKVNVLRSKKPWWQRRLETSIEQ